MKSPAYYDNIIRELRSYTQFKRGLYEKTQHARLIASWERLRDKAEAQGREVVRG